MGPALRGAAVIQGGQGRPPLQSRTRTAQNGTSRTPSPTHSVIARSEATRQSVLPSPKRRISAPVTRSLSRNDSAPRRRDGGTHGSRPTGCGGHPGRTDASAPTRQNRSRAKRDVGDAVPYTLCHCEERSDAAIRSPSPKRWIPTPVCTPRALASRRALARNDSASRCLGGRSRPPLQVFIGDSCAGRRGRRFQRNNKTTRRHAPAGRSYPVDNFS